MFAALLLALATGPTVASRDACEAQVPVALLATLLEAYPEYRLPRVGDNLAEDVAYARTHGAPDGCLGVAIVDFDGDGDDDVALGLSAHRGDGGAVVAALADGDRWQVHEIARWKQGRSRLYVEPVEPGTWHSFFDEIQTDHAGERLQMSCRHAGVMHGSTEVSGVVTCLQPDGWQWVHISD